MIRPWYAVEVVYLCDRTSDYTLHWDSVIDISRQANKFFIFIVDSKSRYLNTFTQTSMSAIPLLRVRNRPEWSRYWRHQSKCHGFVNTMLRSEVDITFNKEMPTFEHPMVRIERPALFRPEHQKDGLKRCGEDRMHIFHVLFSMFSSNVML